MNMAITNSFPSLSFTITEITNIDGLPYPNIPSFINHEMTFFKITEMMNMAIRMMSEMETNAVSVERVQEYTKSDGEVKCTFWILSAYILHMHKTTEKINGIFISGIWDMRDMLVYRRPGNRPFRHQRNGPSARPSTAMSCHWDIGEKLESCYFSRGIRLNQTRLRLLVGQWNLFGHMKNIQELCITQPVREGR